MLNIRFFPYRCTARKVCAYPFERDCKSRPCVGCGKTYEETRTIWDKIEDLYHTIVRYEWRPKNVWYKFKCWAWHRYTTTKPRTLGHDWCDRDGLLIHTVFEIARNFIEKEGPKNEEEWAWQKEHNPAFYESWKETKDILDWWANEYEEMYVWGLTDEQFDKEFPWEPKPEEHEWDPAVSEKERIDILRSREKFKRDDEYEQSLREKAKRIIDISPYYWT